MITVKEYDSLSQVPDVVFQNLIPKESFYFSHTFLAAFEQYNTLIKNSYFIIEDNSEPVAIAILQQLPVHLENATSQLSSQARLAKSIHCALAGRTAQIAVCGSIFLSGDYGVYIKEGVNKELVYAAVATYLKKSAIAQRASVLFFKDFNVSQKAHTSVLVTNKFTAFQVEPNMVLKIDPTWKTVSDYKTQLKSKYRVKVNRADSLSDSLTIKLFNAQDIITHKDRLQQLMANITDRAVVSTIDLNIETYAALKVAFPDKVVFNGYFYNDELLGFATGFIDQDQLDAHFIGMDYGKNKQFGLYPRILNDYVSAAIRLRVSYLNLGRTSSEIKSTLGAIPVPLHCYVRHKRTFANTIFRPFVGQLRSTSFKQHNPFKDA